MTHRPARGMRLVMARLNRDTDAETALIREVGDDAFSWLLIVNELIDMVTSEIAAQLCERRGDLTEDHVIGCIAHCIAKQLDGGFAA
jgi:hypothetical protein